MQFLVLSDQTYGTKWFSFITCALIPGFSPFLCFWGFFWTGNCQLGSAYQGDCSDASSQEEGEKKQLSGLRFFLVFSFFWGGVFFYDTGGSAAWWGEKCMEVCVNRWLRSDCGHKQTKAWPANQACCPSLTSVYFWRSVGKAESVSNPHISQLYLPHHVPRAAVSTASSCSYFI